MKLWLAPHSEVTIREQLVTQVVLGILCDDLEAGQRLPSTRELARRFKVHANTVSAAYKELERAGWLEFRKGSGVYVREAQARATTPPALQLDQLIAGLFRSARELGAPLATVRARLRQWLAAQPPDHFLLIEPDVELRAIVSEEIRAAVKLPVSSAGFEACRQTEALAGAVVVALPSKAERVRRELPADAEGLVLHVRSAPASLAQWLPARGEWLIGIASRWPDFLKRARTMLLAAGLDGDGLLVRDARKAGWDKGLKQTVAVVCDTLTCKQLPKGCRAIPFPLLAEASLDELKRYQDFLSRPLL